MSFNNLVQSFDDFFIGRAPELSLLREHLIEKAGVISLEGLQGIGKSSLARHFANINRDLFPGGIAHLYAFFPVYIREQIRPHINLNQKSLLIMDEANMLPEHFIREIDEIHNQNNKLSILFVSRNPIKYEKITNRIHLNNFNQNEIFAFVSKFLKVEVNNLSEIVNVSKGNPKAILNILELLNQSLILPNNIEKSFEDIIYPKFDKHGIFSQDSKIIAPVSNVNESLLKMIKSNPELMRDIPSRKFEEIIAELLFKQGYEVELTPKTRDGGFDVWAARSDYLGKFIFLVECKKYTPPNKVGVKVVRELFGTLQQNRATAGIIATTSFFTSCAIDFQEEVKHQISLRDFIDLKMWLEKI